jgi:hypothetical protein
MSVFSRRKKSKKWGAPKSGGQKKSPPKKWRAKKGVFQHRSLLDDDFRSVRHAQIPRSVIARKKMMLRALGNGETL